jgi:hypothetical protein
MPLSAWFPFLLLLLPVDSAQGQVYKCTDSGGKTVYADAPCSSGSRPLALPNAGRGGGTDPNLCAQLQDERHRLRAEAERSAERGRKESADSVGRQKALTRTYESRCVGIARSAPKPK